MVTLRSCGSSGCGYEAASPFARTGVFDAHAQEVKIDAAIAIDSRNEVLLSDAFCDLKMR